MKYSFYNKILDRFLQMIRIYIFQDDTLTDENLDENKLDLDSTIQFKI